MFPFPDAQRAASGVDNPFVDQFILMLQRIKGLPEQLLITAAEEGYVALAEAAIVSGAYINIRPANAPSITIIDIAKSKNNEVAHLVVNALNYPPSERAFDYYRKACQQFKVWVTKNNLSSPPCIKSQRTAHKLLRIFRRNDTNNLSLSSPEAKIWARIFTTINAWKSLPESEQLTKLGSLHSNLSTIIESGDAPHLALAILEFAIIENSPVLCKICIDAKAPLNQKLKNFNGNVLHLAIYHERPNIALKLIECDADVNSQNNDAQLSPLMYAASTCDHETIAHLINAGAKIHLHDANNHYAIDFLPNADRYNAQIRLEKTTKHRKQLKHDLKSLMICKSILSNTMRIHEDRLQAWKKSMNPDLLRTDFLGFLELTRNSEVRDNLCVALSCYGLTEIVLLCIQAGANVNARNGVQKTALMGATKYSRHETMRALLEKGADASIRSTYQSETLLMLAVRNNDHVAFDILFECCPTLGFVNANGQNEIAIAKECGHTDMIEKLYMLTHQSHMQVTMDELKQAHATKETLRLSQQSAPVTQATHPSLSMQ